MKMNLRSIFSLLLGATLASTTFAQERFLDEVFDDSEITVIKNVPFGVNIDFLRNQNLMDPDYIQTNLAQIQQESQELRDSIYAGSSDMAFFTPYFTSTDPSTILKITGTDNSTANPAHTLCMDVYMPVTAVDTMAARPTIFYIHTGNFLPPIVNGAPTGSKEDSAAVEMCKQWAKRGYVAIAPNYRHGWNPIASGTTGPVVRRATLLNAVYRAIHDVKRAVRVAKAQSTSFGIDPSNIAIYGQGSGGYVALAYNTLDDQSETATPKFINPATGQSYIDPAVVGDVTGGAGLLNLYGDLVDLGITSDISAQANAGGVLGDISWMQGATPKPMISIHCIRDPFAPFDSGQVIVRTTGENVVPVPGPNQFMQVANEMGVNDVFADKSDYNDPFTFRARNTYNRNFTHYNGSVTIPGNVEGMFPLEIDLESNQFENEGAPWEWWTLSDVQTAVAFSNAVYGTSANANDIHNDALMSNPNMAKAKALNYIDSIQGYLHPRLMLAMGIGNQQIVSTDDVDKNNGSINIYPNPASTSVEFIATGNAEIESFQIFDLSGKAVVNQTSVNGTYYFTDVNALNNGLYIIRMNTNQGVQTHKLVIE